MGNTNSNTSASATGALVAGGALAFYLARCHREASPSDAGESKGSDGSSDEECEDVPTTATPPADTGAFAVGELVAAKDDVSSTTYWLAEVLKTTAGGPL